MTQQGDYSQMGLTTAEAQARLDKYGYNVTESKRKTSFWRKFAGQFGDLMIIILIVASALSFVLAIVSGDKTELIEPIIIIAIVLINATLGTIQEYRAEKSLLALQSLTSPKTKVIRDGKVQLLDSEQIVVDDVCIYETGDVITADGILKQSQTLFVNQSALTGESVPVEKRTANSANVTADNRVYGGSFVTKGHCVVLVTDTGRNTELGKIAGFLAKSQTTLTPLQLKLKQLSKVIGVVCLAVCLAVLVIGFIKGVKQMGQGDTLTGVFVDIFLTSVSLAVAAIPEGLPAVVTIVLAKGIQDMAQKHAVVKRLTAVEALGSATVICSDKTGTLTQNKMSLVGVFDGEKYRLVQDLQPTDNLLQSYCYCCDAVTNDTGQWLGDPTEIAVTSITTITKQFVRLYEIPFDSNRKLMSVVVKCNGKYYAVTKGSLEAMTNASNYDLYEKHYHTYTRRGLRVLALCVKQVDYNFSHSSALEKDLTISALFTIADPPRTEAKHAVDTCKSAGIRPVMITGDNVETATEIARQLGIMQDGDIAVDGDTLNGWTDSQLQSNVTKVAVYARVTPSDKLRIVTAWQANGAVVAMTGDGVNDAPALKHADIGCAMGSGTEVAKDSADIILTDDNFATVVDAVSLGRSVYQNIKKSVVYLLTCNIGEVLSVFVALVLWDVSPLSAMQLLWINLVTDGLPALALGTYKQQSDVMNRPPKAKDENFFSGGGGYKVAFGGVLFALCTLVSFAIGNNTDYQTACSMAFVVLSMSQLFFVLEMRNDQGFFVGGITPLMLISFVVSTVMVAVVVFTPLQKLFQVSALSPSNIAISLALSAVPCVVYEIIRTVTRNKK